MDTKERIKLLYRYILGRDADSDGLAHWTAFAEKSGIGTVAAAMVDSDEYRARERSVAPRPIPPTLLDACLTTLGRDLLIVDVGAQKLDYEEHVYSELLSTAAYKIIGFEPLGQKLKQRVALEEDSRLVMLPDFVGDGSHQTFHVNNFDATSSLYPLNDPLTQLFSDLSSLKTERTETVKTEMLDHSLIESGCVDFLKLDIQGYELGALRGAEQILARTNVVHCEVEFAPIYAGQPLFSEVEIFLRNRGFELIDLVRQVRCAYRVPSGRSAADRLLYAEAVFFRTDQADYLAQAIIAWMVYGKPGLAERLLILHDQDHGTSFGSLVRTSAEQ